MALSGGKSTFISNDSTFVSPSTYFHLTSYILHVTHVLSFCLYISPSLFLSFFFSTDNRQSSHAVHLLCLWRRPSESPNTLSAQIFPPFFSPHVLPSCLLSLSIPMNTTHSIAASLVCSPSLPSLISSLPVFQFNVCFELVTDLKTAVFALPLSSPLQPIYPKPVLHFFLVFIPPSILP